MAGQGKRGPKVKYGPRKRTSILLSEEQSKFIASRASSLQEYIDKMIEQDGGPKPPLANNSEMTHTLHFTNYEEMGYAASHLDCFTNPQNVSEEEFDGGAPFEVSFTTAKALPQTTIKKILKGLNPKDSTFNQ